MTGTEILNGWLEPEASVIISITHGKQGILMRPEIAVSYVAKYRFNIHLQ